MDLMICCLLASLGKTSDRSLYNSSLIGQWSNNTFQIQYTKSTVAASFAWGNMGTSLGANDLINHFANQYRLEDSRAGKF